MWGCVYNGVGSGKWFFGGEIIVFAIVSILIIIAAILILKTIRLNKHNTSINRNKIDTLNILNIRLAKGQINEQEYHKMKNTLLF